MCNLAGAMCIPCTISGGSAGFSCGATIQIARPKAIAIRLRLLDALALKLGLVGSHCSGRGWRAKPVLPEKLLSLADSERH